MIEFTMSRVIVFVCGAILLASVAVPVSDMYESRKDTDMTGVADTVSSTIDSFWNSEADTFRMRGWDVLPSAECSLMIDEHTVTVSDGDKTYTSLISRPCDPTSVSYNQEVFFEKADGRISVVHPDPNVSAIFLSADANLFTSSSLL